ncbi:MAG TPA: dTMP kinase [Candidatus Dormibacteraeota bacterium]|jgi:dTMP kinase|nr:dTMP kinase [Candidatus Dormibacteraeota bacterium]
MRGFLVSLEGGDGSGKTTQAARLAQALEAEGLPVVAVREPGGTRLGEAVRQIVLDVGHDDLAAWAEANLYTAARAQLLREVILPALARGKLVVTDRFADSTLAYQGAGRGLEMAVLGMMQAVLKVRPDLTFLLDIEPEAGFARQAGTAGHVPDRMEMEDLVFHRRVRQGYLDLARGDPERYHVVDAAQPAAAVAAELLRVTMDRANRGPRGSWSAG